MCCWVLMYTQFPQVREREKESESDMGNPSRWKPRNDKRKESKKKRKNK